MVWATRFLVAAFVVAASMLAPCAALACSDAGAPNAACSEGGGAHIACVAHGECPEGQHCGTAGLCTCGDACFFGELEQCTGGSCHCCGTADAGCPTRFVCESARSDAGASMDGGAAPEPAASGGCSAGAASARPSLFAFGLVAGLAMLRSRRR